MNKRELKNCILILCFSYTAASVLLSLLAFIPDMMMNIDHVAYLQLFVCNALISILMHFTSKIPVESEPVAMIIDFLDIAVVIYGVGGGIFKWIPWEMKYIIELFIILLIVYFITYGGMLLQNNVTARAINKKIEERRK